MIEEIFKVVKKGKKRGRPSKGEKLLTAMLNYEYKKHKKDIDKSIMSAIIKGSDDFIVRFDHEEAK